jgi:hypothetical protein
MEDFCLFDRSDGINPFLLFDGHGSWFEEPLIEYTLESNMHCTWCIDVQYVLMICSISRVVEILQPFAKPTVLLDYSLEVR